MNKRNRAQKQHDKQQLTMETSFNIRGKQTRVKFNLILTDLQRVIFRDRRKHHIYIRRRLSSAAWKDFSSHLFRVAAGRPERGVAVKAKLCVCVCFACDFHNAFGYETNSDDTNNNSH